MNEVDRPVDHVLNRIFYAFTCVFVYYSGFVYVQRCVTRTYQAQ